MVDNQTVAAIFSEMADILAIQGENYHRIMAYRRAAENIAALGRPLKEIWQAGELETIPGIGKTLAAKIDELMRTGRLQAYEKLKAQVPEGVVAMLRVPDVGPRKAALFWKELGITSIDELEKAAKAGKLRDLPGMGVRSEQKVLEGIQALKRRTGRVPLGIAWELAQAMLAALREVPWVVQAASAGSLRRMRETVGDLDLLVAAEEPEPVMARFRALPQVAEVLLSGPTKTSIRTHDGFQVDLRVLEPGRWGTALQYFTGSKAHNIRLRGLALDRGLSLSEYAIKREDGTEILCAIEEEVYAALGLPWIPPELREDRGEIEAALEGRLPDLIELAELQGDLQFHTTWSDGHASLMEMAEAARTRGLKYGLVTDHSHGLGVARGVGPEELRRQRAEIEEVNRKLGGTFRVLAGVEVEVRADGSLDLPDEVLAELDLVVAAVHSGLRQGREQVTARAIAAIRNPHVDILAHPTGRLIGRREGADLDMEAVLQAAAETGTAVEINSHPLRLDLNDIHVRRAVELGVTLVINSDAHDPAGFDVLRFGVATARRGWATRANVLNTRSVE
ncbi:MAG TPA: DNA polymerase/3'-5' exonuclease PolX, partial [Anaerolineae bacterium]|nr:DNA polymerase/3'-5' exonuclease PolX [Anaerolineae bacterium]